MKKKNNQFCDCSQLLTDFPASRGLFSVVFSELTGARKRDLCPGSKQTVLNMHHSYQVTEPTEAMQAHSMRAE